MPSFYSRKGRDDRMEWEHPFEAVSVNVAPDVCRCAGVPPARTAARLDFSDWLYANVFRVCTVFSAEDAVPWIVRANIVTREEAVADVKNWQKTMLVTPEGSRERTKHERERILRRKASREKVNE